MAVVQLAEQVLAAAVGAGEGAAGQSVDKFFAAHIADDLVVVDIYSFDALFEGSLVKVTLKGIYFGQFRHMLVLYKVV